MKWIRDILVRIRGSEPLTYGSRFVSSSGSCSFRQWISSFFVYYKVPGLPGTCTSVFKDKKPESHKTIEIKVLFTILLDDGRVRIRSNNDGSGGPKNLRVLGIWIHNTANKVHFLLTSVANPELTGPNPFFFLLFFFNAATLIYFYIYRAYIQYIICNTRRVPLLISSLLPLGRGPPLGCRAEIRTRACHTASRRATVWATPHPKLFFAWILIRLLWADWKQIFQNLLFEKLSLTSWHLSNSNRILGQKSGEICFHEKLFFS